MGGGGGGVLGHACTPTFLDLGQGASHVTVAHSNLAGGGGEGGGGTGSFIPVQL